MLGQGEPAGERAVARLDAMVDRRLTGEPVQYVLGSWAFRHLDLMVDPRVLIPRPETEHVAGVAIELAASLPAPRVVADLGTGSGAIALSLARELPLGSVTVWATEVSVDAADVARANVVGIGRVGVHVRVVEGSWFEPLPAELRGGLDLVVSNPPYVPEGDAALDASVLGWEPEGALFGGPDGLDAVRAIAADAPMWLRPGGWLVLEIGTAQGAAVGALLTDAGLVDVSIRADHAGHDRIAVARRPS
jgi:release factor glutamine methyltransferase